jgi:1-acyl-sn-glycerol-3-phosphate acyltransferase
MTTSKASLHSLGYRFSCFLARLVVRLVTRLEVQGLDNLPALGSYMVASNHLGRLDPAIAYCILDRKDIIMLVAEKYREIPLVPWLVKQLDGIWVDRFNADMGAVRRALTRLRKGGVLVLAPEGTRSKTGSLVQGWAGAGYMAAKAGVPIVPVALVGTEDKVVKANLRKFRRSTVLARAGEPFTLPAMDGKDRDDALKAYTDEIMCRIAALLPPAYRGVYSDHPRLLQLLETA